MPTSTVDDVAGRITSAILMGHFLPGTWLRQEALGERFGVSRQPVREALRQVQAAGLVEVFPHRGALVRSPSPRTIREAYLVRAELEGLAAELATQRLTRPQLEQLRGAEEGFRRSVERALAGADLRDGEDHGWGAANDLFHDAVLNAAGIDILRRQIADLHRAVPRNLTWRAIETRPLLEDNLHQHTEVRGAIEAGDAAAARRAMTVHVRRSGELVASWFERQGE